ncbi:MAG: YbgF trimerization domain-containing protein, partial [Gammaproteobacteria bacterium]|nr:YbgF trimerization domain-containing protein [Gammaproteobacteria bacterium]
MLKSSVKKLILLSFLASPLVFADNAPVVAITPVTATAANNSSAAATTSTSTLTIDQRVAVLERQISAMNQIDLVNEMSRVEQQIQDLQGQVQVLSHTLQTVQSQTTSQYADLDKRLSDAQPAAIPATTTSTATDSKDSNNPTDSEAEKKLYDAAYKNIREQKNAAGIAGMKKYLDKYPDGQNAPNAHYWLGQIYLLKGDDKSVKAAVSEFDTVIKKYPKSDKSKEASLKLGFAYLLQNKNADAK